MALSLISRSITDVAVTTREKESARAFSAAEAGIERALIGQPGDLDLGSATTVTVSVEGTGGTPNFTPLGKFASGDALNVWLVSHDDSGNLSCSDGKCFTGDTLKVCWGTAGTDPNGGLTPAAEVTILYKEGSDYKVARAAYDSNSSRRASNNFTAPDISGCTIDQQDYAFGANISFSSLNVTSRANGNQIAGPQAARVRLIYNIILAHPVGVNAGVNFPMQGQTITSEGKSGDATRKIQVFESYADLPPVFDFAAFNYGGGLTK